MPRERASETKSPIRKRKTAVVEEPVKETSKVEYDDELALDEEIKLRVKLVPDVPVQVPEIKQVNLLVDDKHDIKRKVDELGLTACIQLFKHLITTMSKQKTYDALGLRTMCNAIESLTRCTYKLLHVPTAKHNEYDSPNDSIEHLIDIISEAAGVKD